MKKDFFSFSRLPTKTMLVNHMAYPKQVEWPGLKRPQKDNEMTIKAL